MLNYLNQMIVTRAKILLSKIKFLGFNVLRFALGIFWRKALNRNDSIHLLQGNSIYKKQHAPINIPDLKSKDEITILSLKDFRNTEKPTKENIHFDTDFVWKISTGKSFNDLSLSSSGIAILDHKYLLNLDYGNTSGYREIPSKSNIAEYSLIVAPWSHLTSFSYFGFVSLILTKLCRIEYALGKDIWQSAKLCYPLYNTNYEKEYLKKLNIPDTSIINTRVRGLKIKTKSLILANSQSKINRISPYDIQLLRQRFLDQQSEKVTERRIFLPRRGKRVIENESEIRNLLEKSFGFETLEDISRSIDEQISLFRSASVIVAPHGAALTNLVWCEPGTKVVELFYGGYRKAGFYYICKVLGLEYSCVIDNNYSIENFVNQYHNMKIDLKLLESTLEEILLC